MRLELNFILYVLIMIDWLMFNANFISISAISWSEQIVY
jgi:hypothetical protein